VKKEERRHTDTKAEGIPPGWTYNPSIWRDRLPVLGLAILGFVIATYLSLYQLRIVPDVWEPFFGNGSKLILNSYLSRYLPIPDAALGALGYLFEGLGALVGGRARWRTMPWVVLLLGLSVMVLGLSSLLLVVAQPVFFRAWCTLCLSSAIISFAIVAPAMDEVLATLQHLRRSKRLGHSFLRALWGKAQETLP
jgi:uncharacterized membrane protein